MQMKGDINTSGRAFQFQFDLQIQKIILVKNIDIPKSSFLQVIWKRGQKNISTKLKPQVKGNQQQIYFGQTLSMISTCLLNTDAYEFSPKQSTISVVIYIGGSQKLFGSININLCSVLSSKNYHERGVKYIEEQLNGKTKSKILLKLSSIYLKEMIKSDEQQSIGSGVTSNNNTSNYSIIERRTIQIPSKDTYSVLSYGGAARYSYKKDDINSIRRDQSAKKIQQEVSKQYGRFGGYTQTNFYTKTSNQYSYNQGNNQTPSNGGLISGLLTGLTQNNQNIRVTQSIQSSANRIQRNSDSDPNKSSVGEQNSRLLIQQQTKRSKLQAQVTKNKVENDQLKNKLAQYVRENMKLKQQLRKFYDNNDSRQAQTKKESQQLKQRNYVLTNQIRQLKVRFDRYINLEKDCSNLKMEKQNLARQNKKNEQMLQNTRKELQQTKNHLYKVKQSQNKLFNEMKQVKVNKTSNQQLRKQYQGKSRQLNVQLQYYQNNSKNLSMLLRESQQKFRNCQRQFKNLQVRFDVYRSQQTRKMNQITMNKQRQIRQLNQKVNSKTQQCSKYILQAQRAKNQFGKLKDEKIAEYQVSKNKMNSEIEKLNNYLRQANNKIEVLTQQKNSLNSLIRAEVSQRAKQSDKNKILQQNYSNLQKRYQKQSSQLKKKIQHYQLQNNELSKIISEKNKQFQDSKGHKQQIQQLLKQNLQLQLQIKYKNQQVQKYRQIQQEHQSLKCRTSIQQSNFRQINQSLQKCQKQLRQKNRSYILQCQKTKMLIQQRGNNGRILAQVKQELDNARKVIFNGDKQVKQMDFYISQLQSKNRILTDDLRVLQKKISESNSSDKYLNEIKLLEGRNKQLQARDSQKIKSIQNLNKGLNASNKQIKQLQQISEQRYQQILKKQQIINNMEGRFRQLQNSKNQMEQQFANIQQERRNLTKKNEMIMDELFSYKRKFQEQKGRSHSTVSIRTSQDYIKIKNLQNQLNKKQQKIRKMQKEMIALQNQNVNLSIQVMKKLQDITPK